jgi:hypothetical protein
MPAVYPDHVWQKLEAFEANVLVSLLKAPSALSCCRWSPPTRIAVADTRASTATFRSRSRLATSSTPAPSCATASRQAGRGRSQISGGQRRRTGSRTAANAAVALANGHFSVRLTRALAAAGGKPRGMAVTSTKKLTQPGNCVTVHNPAVVLNSDSADGTGIEGKVATR